MSNKSLNLNTKTKNTWCPGCSNFAILNSFKMAVKELIKYGVPKQNFVLISGIGCSSKIIDYIDLNSLSCLHGRPVVSATGIKLSNPDLKPIVFAGDGGTYNEGIAHLIHAAKRNSDITVLIHDNRNFALTTSQFTATSPKGFKGGSSPKGSVEAPFDPLELMLSSNASFIARGYAFKMDHLKDLIKKAIKHKGFSFVEILQPCVSFYNSAKDYNKRVYKMKKGDLKSKEKALKKINEWDYNNKNSKIPLGIFYKTKKPVFENQVLNGINPSQRTKEVKIKDFEF